MAILEKKVYETIEPGVYPASVESIVEETGKFGEQVKFTFRLGDSDVTLVAWASASYSNKSKLGRWAQAILGSFPDTLDTDTLIGKPCRLMVKIEPREGGDPFNKVAEVLPAKKNAPKPEPAAAADPLDAALQDAGLPY